MRSDGDVLDMLVSAHRRSLPRLCRSLHSPMSPPPPNWKQLAPHTPGGGITTAHQSKLPKLPVPELSDTFSRLKQSLKPLAFSHEELETSFAKIDEFESGLARELHHRLLQRQKETTHWLEEWWDNGAYMGYRDSVSTMHLKRM